MLRDLKKQAFTLVELLIVLTIIGLLAVVGITELREAIERAKVAEATQELTEITKTLNIIKSETGLTMGEITRGTCSDCPCRNDLSAAACRNRWRLARLRTEDLDTGYSILRFEEDPWGRPYMLDENEGEFGACVKDYIHSYGKDGLWQTSDDVIVGGSYLDNVTTECLF